MSSLWCSVRRGLPAQVLSSSLDHGSKLRGDIVGFGIANNEKVKLLASGVVSQVTDSVVSVTFDSLDVSALKSDLKYTMFKMPSDLPYIQMKRAVGQLKMPGGHSKVVRIQPFSANYYTSRSSGWITYLLFRKDE
ncbi:hypothetical protein TNCV_3104351 [Trichonephila clavipes]|nr:hypothetical protein TNCV_3104351 [Trichonephila clavipes]